MTTPQPQPIKRYEPCREFADDDDMVGYPAMQECPYGDYIRHDDPALVAAREALQAEIEWFDNMIRMHMMVGDHSIAAIVKLTHGKRIERLRLALAGLTPKEGMDEANHQ